MLKVQMMMLEAASLQEGLVQEIFLVALDNNNADMVDYIIEHYWLHLDSVVRGMIETVRNTNPADLMPVQSTWQ